VDRPDGTFGRRASGPSSRASVRSRPSSRERHGETLSSRRASRITPTTCSSPAALIAAPSRTSSRASRSERSWRRGPRDRTEDGPRDHAPDHPQVAVGPGTKVTVKDSLLCRQANEDAESYSAPTAGNRHRGPREGGSVPFSTGRRSSNRPPAPAHESWPARVSAALRFVLLAVSERAPDFPALDDRRASTTASPPPGKVPRTSAFNSKLPVTDFMHSPSSRSKVRRPNCVPVHEARGDGARVEWAAPSWGLSRWGPRGSGAPRAVLVARSALPLGRLAGPPRQVAGALLAALEPNLLAHLHLVTSDGGRRSDVPLRTAALRFTR